MRYRGGNHRRRSHWLLLSITGLIGLAGYFGPWVPHKAAGLVVAGLDLAEYVKFLPQVQTGEIALRREIFYAPLFAGSVIASLIASRRALPPWGRVLLGFGAIPVALAMLPPAWSPQLLRLPEYRLQMIGILLCLLGVPGVFLARFLPNRLILVIIATLAMTAALLPAWGFLQVRSPIVQLYHQRLAPGLGFWATIAGFTATALIASAEGLRRDLRPEQFSSL